MRFSRKFKTKQRKRWMRVAVLLAVPAFLLMTGANAHETTLTTCPPPPAPQPRIEVCFVLDTTGSMSGLIEGAKAKIWSIANQMISAEPTPELRVGLVGFRDRGDAYVTRLFDLNGDIDTVYQDLGSLQAGGGGDGPESVNQALYEAVNQMSWSSDRDVLKIVFLVGDCPPHMDYSNDVRYPVTCKAAVKQDLIINTVQCGSNSATTPVWKEIARMSEGSFVSIGQTGNMTVITTPVDDELARLNVEMGRTIVAYGERKKRAEVAAKQVAAEAAAPSATADRLAFGALTREVVQGGGDLIDDLRDGEAELEELDKDALPEEMKGMSVEEMQVFVGEQSKKRQEIQDKINELLKKRQAHIAAEQERLAREGKGSAFDTQVAEILKEQALRKGIRY